MTRIEGRLKVLLIEDDANFAFVVEALLRRQTNLSVTRVNCLKDAFAALDERSPDIILLDLTLPDADGLATLTRLRQRSGEIPIIVLTGNGDEESAMEAVRLGAQDYLVKGEFENHGLLRAIRYAIERRNNEDKYRELVESIDAIVWAADPVTWRFTFVSKAAEKLLGYPIERWLQVPDFWLNLIHPDDRSRAFEYCQGQVAKGKDHEFEYRVVALDGRLVWLRDSVQVVKDEAGRPIILRGVMIDITESKNAAAELQIHHQEIQSLQEISQIILEEVEPGTGIQRALEKSIAACGFDFGDILLTTPDGEFVSVVAAYGFSDPTNLQRTRRRRSSTHRREHLQQSSIIHNMQARDRFRSLKPEGAETAVIVPLRAGDHSLGLLQLVSRRAKEVRPNELALAEAMGRQIGIAIQKAKLTDELQTNLRRIKTLYESNIALNSTLDLRAVLEILLDQMDFGPSHNAIVAIQLIDRETGLLEYFANRNLDEQAWIREYGGNRNISAAGLTKHTIESGSPTVVQDLRTDRRVLHPEFFCSQGLFSYLGVPVRIKERPVGIVAIYSRVPYEFSAEEISSVASLASHAAIAIHNARLYAEVEKQSRELAALFDVTAAATQSLEMDRVLDEVIRRINEIFLFDATRFYLFDDQAEWLHCRATHQVNPIFLTRTLSFKKGQGITGRVGATGVAIIFNDTQGDPQYQLLSQSKKSGQRFLAGFPVKYESKTLGVIMCMGKQPRQLTSHEIDLITSLSSQIAVAIANARLYEQTKVQAGQLRNLAVHIESVREQERRIISREIHDELGQTLTALKFDASWIRGKLFNDQPALADRLGEMSAMIDDTIQAIRKIAARLRPDILDKLGLAAAMEWQLQDFRHRTGIQYHLTADPIDIHLDEHQATTLFRIFQESLTNIARHSHATRVNIDLEHPAGEVFLRVEDDGDGIDNEKIFDTQSLGLLGMRERAVALGGNVTVERNLNRGTTLTAHLPIDRNIHAGAFLSRSEPI